MIHGVGIGRIDKDAEHAVPHELHGVRTKQIHRVAYAAVELLHDGTEFGTAQGLRPLAVMTDVGEQHRGTFKLATFLRRAAVRPLLAERLNHPCFVKFTNFMALFFKRKQDGVVHHLGAHGVCPFAFVELCADGLAQLLRRKRLGQVIVRASRHALSHIAAVLQRGKQDDGSGRQRRIVSDMVEYFKTIQQGHLYVADD